MNLLLLDLEATIIDHWSTFGFLDANVRLAQSLIASEDIDRVGIFSYAIWNDENLAYFEEKWVPEFKSLFGDKFDPGMIVTVDEMMFHHQMYAPHNNNLSMSDFWRYVSKEHAVMDYVRQLPHHRSKVVLLDDTVRDARFVIIDERTTELVLVKAL